MYYGDLTVTRKGLTPYATYRTDAGSFTASATGSGTAKATGVYLQGGVPVPVTVAREEPQADGSVKLTVVLEGTLVP